MILRVSTTSQTIEIDTERSRRLVLVVLSLLRQIEAIDRGKVTLTWGPRSPIHWAVESHGDDVDAISTT